MNAVGPRNFGFNGVFLFNLSEGNAWQGKFLPPSNFKIGGKTMKEIWKDIEGYEGLYQVSNFGNVRSLNYNHRGIVKNLRLAKNSRGYIVVELSVAGKGKMFLVHRLVAIAFLANQENLPEVNHKDEVKHNNRVDNLEWCTRIYNDAYGTGRVRQIAAISKPVEQLKNGVVVKRWPSGSVAGRCGYSQTSINDCCNGKQRKHKGYEWRFAI